MVEKLTGRVVVGYGELGSRNTFVRSRQIQQRQGCRFFTNLADIQASDRQRVFGGVCFRLGGFAVLRVHRRCSFGGFGIGRFVFGKGGW